MATNLERTDIVLGMDIEGGKPASLLKTDKKKKGQVGVATNPGRTGSDIGMVVVAGKPAPLFKLFKRKKKISKG